MDTGTEVSLANHQSLSLVCGKPCKTHIKCGQPLNSEVEVSIADLPIETSELERGEMAILIPGFGMTLSFVIIYLLFLEDSPPKSHSARSTVGGYYSDISSSEDFSSESETEDAMSSEEEEEEEEESEQSEVMNR